MKTLIYGHLETLRKKAKLHINKENWEQTYVLNDTLLNCQPTPEKVAGNQNVELGTLIRPWIWTILFPGFCNIFNIKKLRGQKIWKLFPGRVMTVHTISSNVETKSNPVHFLIKTTSNSEYCQQTWNFSPPISQVSWAPEYLVTSTRVLCGSEQQGSFNPSVSQSHNNDNMTIVTTPSHLWIWRQWRHSPWTRFH